MQLCKIESNMHKKIHKSKRYAQMEQFKKNTKNAKWNAKGAKSAKNVKKNAKIFKNCKTMQKYKIKMQNAKKCKKSAKIQNLKT